MSEKIKLGYLYAGQKLAEFVSKKGKLGLGQYEILNTNNESVERLTGDQHQRNPEIYGRKNILKEDYGIASNPFALLLVRLIAFSIINTKQTGLSWYESPLLGTIKARIPKAG
ncbi:MAG: hypothetical protein AAB876_02610 [Patescibacteria group bacterium]